MEAKLQSELLQLALMGGQTPSTPDRSLSTSSLSPQMKEMLNAYEQSALLGNGQPLYARLATGELVVVTNIFDQVTADALDPEPGDVEPMLVGYDLYREAWISVPHEIVLQIGPDVMQRVAD